VSATLCLDFDAPPRELPRVYRFRGATFDPALDGERLQGQLGRVFRLMEDRRWRTLAEISAATGGDPEASVSARLRDIRAAGFTVERRRRGEPKSGLHEYRVTL
jgi:hypothetical protein